MNLQQGRWEQEWPPTLWLSISRGDHACTPADAPGAISSSLQTIAAGHNGRIRIVPGEPAYQKLTYGISAASHNKRSIGLFATDFTATNFAAK